MILKLVILAVCLVYGASDEEEKKTTPNIFEALHVNGTYLLLWRQGYHFIRKCVFMEITGVNKTNRRIYANLSEQSRSLVRRKSSSRYTYMYYFRTYKNGSSYLLSSNIAQRWRDDRWNFRMNYTSENKSCFVATEVTKNHTMFNKDVNGCEVWINATSLPTGNDSISLQVFDECISFCHKPNLSMHTMNDISYHPNCTYPGNFKPIINGTWQQDIDKLEKERQDAEKWRESPPDDEEAEDLNEEPSEKEEEEKEEENIDEPRMVVVANELDCTGPAFNRTNTTTKK
uniref:30kDa ATSP n=1 Tax=Argas monolakensis TaxID=34602 RepID=Q09JX7_ARGMO|nr:30kDa ATSP [Argas monolakensis]